MNLGFGDGPELKIPVIPAQEKRPAIESNDARVTEVNAKAGFSHPTEQPSASADAQKSPPKRRRPKLYL